MPYVEVTISQTLSTGNLTDFWVLLIGDEFPQAYWDHTSAGGQDVLPKLPDGTVLAKNMRFFDQATKVQTLWVEIPSHLTSADTVIRLHYDGTSTHSNTAVGDSDTLCFLAGGVDGSNQLLDIGPAGAHFAGTNLTVADNVTALTGVGTDLDGSAEYASRAVTNPFSANQFTFTFCGTVHTYQTDLDDPNWGTRQIFDSKSASTVQLHSLSVTSDAGGVGHAAVNFNWDGTAYAPGAREYLLSPNATTLNQRITLTGSYDGTTLKLFENGALVASKVNAQTLGVPDLATVGRFAQTALDGYFDGVIEALIVSRIAHSEAYILGQMRTLLTPASYYAVGAEASDYAAYQMLLAA